MDGLSEPQGSGSPPPDAAPGPAVPQRYPGAKVPTRASRSVSMLLQARKAFQCVRKLARHRVCVCVCCARVRACVCMRAVMHNEVLSPCVEKVEEEGE